MNWGWRIAIFYGSFVVLMVGMVIAAFQQDFDLVADDYYEQEIAYQGRIDQLTNAQEDNLKIRITSTAETVNLTFPGPSEEVKVHFFRPSDDTMDFLVEEASVDSSVRVSKEKFTKGKYLVKTEWKSNGKV